MTIEQLQYFMAIAKYKNFSVAAEECFISQSSLSKQIKALEAELGEIELFDRNTKKLEITYAGKEFSIFAERILMEYQKLMNNMKRLSEEHAEILKIGSIPVMDHYGLSDIFFQFQQYYSNIRLQIMEANSTPLVEEFKKGKIDVAFMRDNYLPVGNYEVYPLVDDELVLVTSYSHWLAAYDTVDLKRAENEKFLFLGSNTGMYDSCVKACRKAGFAPREQVMDVRSNTLKNLVANGQGVALMMYRSVTYTDDARIKIIKLKDPYIINLSLVVRKGVMTDAMSAFIEYVCDSFGKLESNQTGRALEEKD